MRRGAAKFARERHFIHSYSLSHSSSLFSVMKQIALKIDVDTCRGTMEGVPALLRLLLKYDAQGSFFFSLGPDHTGRETGKAQLKRYYDYRTRLYGFLLPAPETGARCLDILRETQRAGFETALHAWNRVSWEKRVGDAPNSWVEAEMQKAVTRFSEIFSTPPLAHAAAGWKMNRHALRLTQRLGFFYASDCRGAKPFIPVIDGEIVLCPQIPTTLPTFDEILQRDALSPIAAVERIFDISETTEGDQVFTLRAEIEGMRFISPFEHLLRAWKKQGNSLIALQTLQASLNLASLPRNRVVFDEIPGRTGKTMRQGAIFP
ncbi:MAG: polysaccharide deacetylase family protein [Candidatus Accumulibacter sp.]|nr:polysaccharide deacetylase family protein [Accumulibacter sp.]